MTAARWHLANTWWRPLVLALLVFTAEAPSCMTARLWRDDVTGVLGERREAGYEVQQRVPVELWWPAAGAGSLRVVVPGDAAAAGGQCFELTPSATATFAGLRDGDGVRVFAIDDGTAERRWLLQPGGFAPVPPRGDLGDLAFWIEAGSVPCTARAIDGPVAGDVPVARAELLRILTAPAAGRQRTAVKLALTPVAVVVDIGSGVLFVLHQWGASAPSGDWLAYNLR